MKLLIITQKVNINDDLLGFFHSWIAEFAKKCEKVTVIALGAGEYNLPENVKVLSLGKELKNFQFSIFNFQFKKIIYIINFYRYIWKFHNDYDTVFVHMNKEYVVLGGLFWRLAGKKIGLWYVHKQVSIWLKLAEILSNVIFSSSNESFKLKSKKVKFVGHGIDFNKFNHDASRIKNVANNFKIIYLGRISRIKNQKLLIEAMNILVYPFKSAGAGAEQFSRVKQRGIKNIIAELIGAPVTSDDEIYLDELRRQVEKYDLRENIIFSGSMAHSQIHGYLKSANLSVNLCPTGGLDKSVLEFLASAVPVIALNKIFADIFKGYEKYFILEKANPSELAEKILIYKNLSGREKIILELKNRIKKDYGLEKLIKKIVDILNV